ncbi:spo0B-associated GTP-binding protein [Trichinella spiralis]|uniref:spo0B-associated GTP-binding protein n=1 Tax=Trichinella spiralis TaxID=6334 RepID=UPI0001EFD188|nr:spo0B-associated GTP-binding protein [Trichinella spiralis]
MLQINQSFQLFHTPNLHIAKGCRSCDAFCRTMRGNFKLGAGFKVWSKILTKQTAIADSAAAADNRYKLKVPKKPRAAGNTKSHFVDFKTVRTIGGNGGDGMIAFLSLYRNSRAGPSGGDGGNGGHVIFQADSSLTSLAKVPRVIRARAGENGRGKSCHGASANHFCVRIPTGTVCRREAAGTGDEVELKNHGEIFIAARGGAGGRGNQSFVSATWQAPTIAEAGGRGEDIVYQLELRLLADVDWLSKRGQVNSAPGAVPRQTQSGRIRVHDRSTARGRDPVRRRFQRYGSRSAGHTGGCSHEPRSWISISAPHPSLPGPVPCGRRVGGKSVQPTANFAPRARSVRPGIAWTTENCRRQQDRHSPYWNGSQRRATIARLVATIPDAGDWRLGCQWSRHRIACRTRSQDRQPMSKPLLSAQKKKIHKTNWNRSVTSFGLSWINNGSLPAPTNRISTVPSNSRKIRPQRFKPYNNKHLSALVSLEINL